MDEAILLPSPNWFLVSGLAVSKDGWIIYGGPSKSLCVLEPLAPENSMIVSEKGYRTHYFPKVHGEKVTSLDISPAWLEKKSFITGSAEGTVKMWNLEKEGNEMNLKFIYNHSLHSSEQEDVVGVGYSTSNFAVTVGYYGRIVKWDLHCNVVKSYSMILSKFKPTCMACSPHVCLQVAVGTKQGVVMVIDLNDTGTIIYKVRSHDEEVLSLSWCPQFNVVTTKLIQDFEPKYSGNKRTERIRKEANKEVNEELDVTPNKPIQEFVPKYSANMRMEKIRQEANKEVNEELDVVTTNPIQEVEPKHSADMRMEKIRQDSDKEVNEELDDSAITKTLPDDSFDETVVEEEDLFDVYKDHEEDEFGHKKYTPEVIVVKEQEVKSSEFDYLAECKNLKDKILNSKDEPEPEPSINSLVDALDKTHVSDNNNKEPHKPKKKVDTSIIPEFCKYTQQHLLAAIGKYGQVRVLSKFGKLMGNIVLNKSTVYNRNQIKVNQPPWGSLLWYKPDVLLITDAKGQLVECNPILLDGKNKLETRVVDTIHKRGTYCIVTNAPRVQNNSIIVKGENGNQTHNGSEDNEQHQNNQQNNEQSNNEVVPPEDQWFVWTAAQDRTLVCYSMMKRKKVFTYHTCGGFIYNIQTCPYDAKKVAVCVGDGAIRLWEANVAENNDEKLVLYGHVSAFWQNVQGKVLVAAWHPTRENILAFGTAESRVGILDVSGSNQEKPARVLNVGITGSVYSLCWGEHNDLFVCSGRDIVLCNFKKGSESFKTIPVELEGERWRVSAVNWYPSGLLCGSLNGSVALLSNTTFEIQAVNFLFKKLINSIEWHPLFISSSSEESSLKNLVAVCAMDKCYKIAVLRHNQIDDGKHELAIYNNLVGHKGAVLQLAWSPHHEGRLASTSTDYTARIWDVTSGTCTAIYPGKCYNPISLAWSAFPQLAGCLVTGGADHSVRFWKADNYPPEAYKEILPASLLPRREKKKRTLAHVTSEQEELQERSVEELANAVLYGEGREAEQMAQRVKAFKRFLLPICSKQMGNCTAQVARMLAEKIMGKEGGTSEEESTVYDTDFLKMFGSINELNELLDLEMAQHLVTKDTDAWIMLAIFRGQMDAMIQFASENDLMCPFLVSLSPCVSFKYWKDVMQLYLAQINRLIAQERDYKLMRTDARSYGGPTFRKVALLLSVHDVKGAVDCLNEARLFREAYILCRIRHMESVARDTLYLWIKEAVLNGYMKSIAISYIALGELYKASSAIVAGVYEDKEAWLSLAAYLAKLAGHHTFAEHIEEMLQQIEQAPNSQEIGDTLQELPSRIELMLKNSGTKNDLEDENGVRTDTDNDTETKE